MEKNIAVKSILDSIKKLDDTNREYWFARELMPLLGYNDWESFNKVILKAINSLQKTYPDQKNHFKKTTKKIKVSIDNPEKSTIKEVIDYKLSRFACYLIVQNGDSNKNEIALAQSYFAIQTRKQELRDANYKNSIRLKARKKLSETEKKFSGVLDEHGVSSKGIAEVRSAGDEALFDKNTREMKQQLGADDDRPLADFVPTITLKAKDFAAEMTTFQTIAKDLRGKENIKKEHIHNNSEIRKLLNKNNIYPEKLPAEEDIRKVAERLGMNQPYKELSMNDFEGADELTIDLTQVSSKKELKGIKNIIEKNNGSTKLKILYGKPIKVIDRSIKITPEVIKAFSKYIILKKD